MCVWDESPLCLQDQQHCLVAQHSGCERVYRAKQEEPGGSGLPGGAGAAAGPGFVSTHQPRMPFRTMSVEINLTCLELVYPCMESCCSPYTYWLVACVSSWWQPKWQYFIEYTFVELVTLYFVTIVFAMSVFLYTTELFPWSNWTLCVLMESLCRERSCMSNVRFADVRGSWNLFLDLHFWEFYCFVCWFIGANLACNSHIDFSGSTEDEKLFGTKKYKVIRTGCSEGNFLEEISFTPNETARKCLTSNRNFVSTWGHDEHYFVCRR